MIIGMKSRSRIAAWLRARSRGILGVCEQLEHESHAAAAILRDHGADVGPHASVVGPLTIVNCGHDFSRLHIGRSAHVGAGVLLDLTGAITIEDQAVVAMRAILLTHQDAGASLLAARAPRRVLQTTVCRGAYIGAGAIVLAGCRVGEGAVVGAGAVVTKDVAAGQTVAGVPAAPTDPH
jgi:maltose O-acetyltransferase